MSVDPKTTSADILTEDDLPMDWERLFILGATIVILFFYTRASPFPAGTYWDLLFARDFDLNIGWALLPENLAYLIVQSSASMLGLKTIYHIAYFLLCSIVAVWVFKGKEVLPGIVVLGIFAIGLQPILTLRWTLQLLFLAGLISMFDGDYLKHSFGVALIPVTAAASALGLNSWLLLVLIMVHVLVNDEFRLTLILCGLIGILFFPEGAASAVLHAPLSTLFQRPDDAKMLTLLGGIFLVPNLLALPRMGEEDLPSLIFYAFTGVLALLDPSYVPCFILVGAFLIFLNLGDIEPLSTGTRLVGVLLLALVLHVSLFLNPIGFSLNPTVRGEIGAELATLMNTNFEQRRVEVHEMGELAWKGLIEITPEDLPLLVAHRSRPLTVMNKDGMVEWYSDLTLKAREAREAARQEALASVAEPPPPLNEPAVTAGESGDRLAHTLEGPLPPDSTGRLTTPEELMVPPGGPPSTPETQESPEPSEVPEPPETPPASPALTAGEPSPGLPTANTNAPIPSRVGTGESATPLPEPGQEPPRESGPKSGENPDQPAADEPPSPGSATAGGPEPATALPAGEPLIPMPDLATDPMLVLPRPTVPDPLPADQL